MLMKVGDFNVPSFGYNFCPSGHYISFYFGDFNNQMEMQPNCHIKCIVMSKHKQEMAQHKTKSIGPT